MEQILEPTYTFKLTYYIYHVWMFNIKCVLIGENCWEFITNPNIEGIANGLHRDKRDFKWRMLKPYATMYHRLNETNITIQPE